MSSGMTPAPVGGSRDSIVQAEIGPLPGLKARIGRLRIVLYEPAGRGGICHYTWELAEHLSKAGHEVLLLTTQGYELRDRPRSFRVHFLFRRSRVMQIIGFAFRWRRRTPAPAARAEAPKGRESRNQLRFLKVRLLQLWTLGRFLLRRPDVVHFQWIGEKCVDLGFMRALRRLGALVVYTAHDVRPHENGRADDLKCLASIYGLVDRVIVHADANRRELVQKFDVSPRKIAIIPHGFYDFRLGRETLTAAAARAKLGLPVAGSIVLFFGLIKPYKGLEYLVAAHEKVTQQLGEVLLLIVGDISKGNPDAYHHYVDFLAKLGSRRDVRVITEYVPVEDIATYLAAADVVALPYTHTSQSGVLLAAYGASRPVVVTDTGGLAEIVKPGETGLVVPPMNAEALAGALTSILSVPGRAAAMGFQAGRLAMDSYSWERSAEATIALYRAGLKERREGRSAGRRFESPPSL